MTQNPTRIARFIPEQWINDNAVPGGPAFTFEVTTALANLRAEAPAAADEVDTAVGHHDILEMFWENAIESGQIPTVHDGPFTIELLPADSTLRINFPERTEASTGTRDDENGNYDLAARATTELTVAEKVRLIGYLTGSIAEGDDSTITVGVNLIPNQALLGDGGAYLVIQNIEPSSAMPGFIAVETEVGTLYLDPEVEYLTLD